jgi:hypothetical protein
MQPTFQSLPVLQLGVDDRSLSTRASASESKDVLDSLIAASAEQGIENGEANSVIRVERPVHRVICYMALSGSTNKEIAEVTGYGVSQVANVLKQPRAKAFMAEQARVIAGSSVEKFFAAEAHRTAQKMIELRDSEAVPAAVRLAACVNILDRHLGKPTQYVKTEQVKDIDSAVREKAEIDAELASLRKSAYGDPSGTN